jgi:hypothetical protein
MSDLIENTYRLDWQGPFILQGVQGNLLFDSPVAKQWGIYLFTVEYHNGYLIYFAGLTTRSFKQRCKEHIEAYRTGVYTIFDAKSFQQGKRVKVWHGFWFRKRTDEMEDEFLARCQKIESATEELLLTFRIFLAPLETEKRILERLEAAIMNVLYSGVGAVSSLPDRGMALSPRRLNEKPFLAYSTATVCLHGLPESFEA